MSQWDAGAVGVMNLPSGLRVRGRGLRRDLPDGPAPEFGVYLLGDEPPAVAWESEWVQWPDFRLPRHPVWLREMLLEIRERATDERVEIACEGGRGRTGTALACLAVLDGVAPEQAVAYVRAHYDRRAVETPWQRRFVKRFS